MLRRAFSALKEGCTALKLRGLQAVGWWAAFAGMFVSTAACPCCGNAAAGCPTSLVGASLIGVVGAWLMTRVRERWGTPPAVMSEVSAGKSGPREPAQESAREELLSSMRALENAKPLVTGHAFVDRNEGRPSAASGETVLAFGVTRKEAAR